MPSWQFETHLNPNHTLSVPPDVANQLDPAIPVQVVLIATEGNEDANWRHLTTEQFVKSDAPGDDIYDQLPEG